MFPLNILGTRFDIILSTQLGTPRGVECFPSPPVFSAVNFAPSTRRELPSFEIGYPCILHCIFRRNNITPIIRLYAVKARKVHEEPHISLISIPKQTAQIMNLCNNRTLKTACVARHLYTRLMLSVRPKSVPVRKQVLMNETSHFRAWQPKNHLHRVVLYLTAG